MSAAKCIKYEALYFCVIPATLPLHAPYAGSIERIVELHDRGVFGGGAGAAADDSASAAGDGTDNGGGSGATGGADGDIRVHVEVDGRGDELTQPLLLQPAVGETGGRAVGAHGNGSAEAARTASDPEVGPVQLPHPSRPDFTRMLGGVRLNNVRGQQMLMLWTFLT